MLRNFALLQYDLQQTYTTHANYVCWTQHDAKLEHTMHTHRRQAAQQESEDEDEDEDGHVAGTSWLIRIIIPFARR